MPDRLLPSRLLGDFLEGQGNFDETLEHSAASPRWLYLRQLGGGLDNNRFCKSFTGSHLQRQRSLLSNRLG